MDGVKVKGMITLPNGSSLELTYVYPFEVVKDYPITKEGLLPYVQKHHKGITELTQTLYPVQICDNCKEVELDENDNCYDCDFSLPDDDEEGEEDDIMEDDDE